MANPTRSLTTSSLNASTVSVNITKAPNSGTSVGGVTTQAISSMLAKQPLPGPTLIRGG